MKNLIAFSQKSILIFAVFFLIACARDEEPFLPNTLPYESVHMLPQTVDNSPPPIGMPVGELEKFDKFRYLSLYDGSMKNAIVIKITTEDRDLLNSLNTETVKFIALDRILPHGVTAEAVKSNNLEQRAALKPIEIEVLETKLQKNVRLYGLKFVRTDLIKATDSYAFTFKNSNVTAVHIVGKDAIKDISRFSAQISDCSECRTRFLAPHFFAANNMISFYNDKKTSIVLKENSRFTDDILIYW